MPRFTYNSVSGQCEGFNYGGCGGNDNNFMTHSACVEACMPQTTEVPEKERNQHTTVAGNSAGRDGSVDTCSLPVDQGPCFAMYNRFAFDVESDRCRRFTFGGCEGNGNNFESLRECQERCPSRVQNGEDDEPEIGLDMELVCSMPSEMGNCRSLTPMFWYNHANRRCELFMYGGCEGNANRYSSSAECETSCSFMMSRGFDEPIQDEEPEENEEVSDELPTSCMQPKHIGPCRSRMPRYYYDATTSSCRRFDYGGCDANANNFETLEQCQGICEPGLVGRSVPAAQERRPGDACAIPADEGGDCGGDQDMSGTRYYFRYTSDTHGVCEPFDYLGCGGNRNNFRTVDHCQSVCGAGEK